MPSRSRSSRKKGKVASLNKNFVPWLFENRKNNVAFVLDPDYRFIWYTDSFAIAVKKRTGKNIRKGSGFLTLTNNPTLKKLITKHFDEAIGGEQIKAPILSLLFGARTKKTDHVYSIKNPHGKVIGLAIEELRASQKKEKAESRKFSSLLKSSLESIDEAILVTDLKEHIIFFNQNFLKFWSIPAELARKKNDRITLQFVLDQVTEPEKFLSRIRELYQSVSAQGFDYIELKDGRVFKRFTQPHYQGKRLVGRVWSFRDITEEVQNEKKLTEWKNRYELVVAASGRVVYDYDLSSGKRIWSGNIKGVLGYSTHEMGDVNTWIGLIHEEDRENAVSSLEKVQKTLGKFEVNYRFKTKHNGYTWIKDNGFFISNHENVAYRMVGEMEDITQQVQTEREIRHLASFPFHYPEVVIEIRKDGTLSYGNPSFYETVRRLKLENHSSFIPHLANAQLMLGKAWRNTEEILVKGRTFSLKIFYLPEKELLRIYALDLTDRLESEKQKSELELTYKTLFEGANDPILIISLDNEQGKIISANAAAARMYQYSLAELLDLSIQDLDVITEMAPLSFEERLQKILQHGRLVFEVTHQKKDGSIFPVEIVVNTLEVSEKKYLMVIGRDITFRKKSEEEIQHQYRFIESLVSASPDIVYVYDIDQDGYIYANQNMVDSYGYPIERLKAEGHKLISTVLAPEDEGQISYWTERLKNANDNEVIESQFRLRGPDGVWRAFRCRESVFLRDDRGRVKQFIGSAHDISDKVAAESALRESEERFRALHEAMFAGIAIHDNGVIVECNKGLSDLSGYSYSELIGLDGMKIVHPEDWHIVFEKLQNADENPYDIRGLRKDGTIIELEIHGKAIPYKGKMLRITEFRDITERKKSAEKIIEQNTRLQAITDDLKFKNEQLDEFTQIVSHNLRSPAGNIVSLTQFLQDPDYTEDKSQVLGLLQESGYIILNTLSELNEILKIKQNKNIERQELFFDEVLCKVKSMMNAHITSTGAVIESDFSNARSILFPNIYLESIMLNLLSNALKYNHPERLPHITFVTRQNQDSVALEVSDNGLGIDLERYGHQVFKLRKTFHQHPDSRGIGLFMIKNQIETLGGKIGVFSAEGVGSTFTITFNK